MPESTLVCVFLKLLVTYTPSSLSPLRPYLDMHSSLGNWSSLLSMLDSCVLFQRFHCLTLKVVKKSPGTTIINSALYVREYLFIVFPCCYNHSGVRI